MNYPEKLKIGDTIGICAPSCGIDDENKIIKLEEANKQLTDLGYKIIETKSVRKNIKGRSADAKTRAEEFMELLLDDEVKLIIFAAGGDYLCEMLDFLDFDKIKNMQPKWLQGYSDITGIGFVFNVLLDIPTIYAQNIKDYSMKPLHRSLTDALKIAEGKDIIQYSFDMCERPWLFDNGEEQNKNTDFDPNEGYNLTEKVIWKNLKNEDKIEIAGRAIGGCLDCILGFIGTKYDNISNYIEKHKEDGIIWFFDCFELGSSALFRALWQFKNAGYFKYCNGIVFGRPLFTRDDYGISFNDSIIEALGDLNIPIITDVDIGHVSPQMAILNGGFLEIVSENGKGFIKTFIK